MMAVSYYTCNKLQPGIFICKNLTLFVFKNGYLSFLKLFGIIIISHTWSGTKSPIFVSFNDCILFFVIFWFFIRIVWTIASFAFCRIRIAGATPAMCFIMMCVALDGFLVLLVKYLYWFTRTLWVLMRVRLKIYAFIWKYINLKEILENLNAMICIDRIRTLLPLQTVCIFYSLKTG